MDIICTRGAQDYALVRLEDGSPLEHVVRHSPTGMEYGYGGSGPADLALSALTYWHGSKIANACYHEYKFAHVARLPRDGGILARVDADAFVESYLERLQETAEEHGMRDDKMIRELVELFDDQREIPEMPL